MKFTLHYQKHIIPWDYTKQSARQILYNVVRLAIYCESECWVLKYLQDECYKNANAQMNVSQD